MRFRRSILLIAALAVFAAACSAGDREVQLQEGDEPVSGLAMELAQDEQAATDPDLIAQQTTTQVEVIDATVATVLDGLSAECAAATGALDRASADLSDRTFVAPAELRCARLADASLEGAVIEDVDLSGASLAGANLRDARLRIVAVGVDFTGADLTGADLTGSDLTGAVFNSATLVGSNLTGLVTSTEALAPLTTGGLTAADLTGARLGCNELEGSPRVVLASVVFDDSCTSGNPDGRIDMSLSGSLLGADLTSLSFARIHLLARDFRAATLVNASLAEYGVLPSGLSFVGADLTGANLSSNTFEFVMFSNANMTGTNLSASVIADSWFTRANMTSTDLSSVESEHNDYRAALISSTNFTNATLSWDDFSGATFSAPVTEGLVIEAVVCDGTVGADSDNGNSVRNFGLCTVGSDLIF